MRLTSGPGLHVLAKHIGPVCDIQSEYCFYLEKHALFGRGENYRMPDEELAAYIETTANSRNGNSLIERCQFTTFVNGQSQREFGDWAIRQLGNWGDRAIGSPRSENGECGCGLYRVADSPVLRGRGVFARVGSWNSTRRQATRGFLTVKSGNRPKSRSAVQSSWTP